MGEVVPANFGPRTFTSKIEFQDKKGSVYVSGIGPSLHMVPIDMVNSVTAQRHSIVFMQRRILVFTKGTGITLKGVTRFSDSDHVLAYSKRFIAVIHPTELFSDNEQLNVTLCSKRVVELPDNLEMFDMKAFSSGQMLIVCKQEVLIAELVKNSEGRFLLETGPRRFITVMNGGLCGQYDIPPMILGRFRSCIITGKCLKRSMWKVYLSGESNRMVVLDPESPGVCGIIAEDHAPFVCEKPANAISAYKANGQFTIAHITDTHLSTFCTETEQKQRCPLQSFARTNFAKTMHGGLGVLARGSLLLYTLERSDFGNYQRRDILIGAQISDAFDDVPRNRTIVAGEDSSWKSVNLRDDKKTSEQPCKLEDRVFSFGNTIYKFSKDSRMRQYILKNGELTDEKDFGALLEPGFEELHIQPSNSTSTLHRFVLSTDRSVHVFDFPSKLSIRLSKLPSVNKYAIPLGKDVLMHVGENMVLLDSENRMKYRLVIPSELLAAFERYAKILVRRLTCGNLSGILIAYQSVVYHVVYDNSPDAPEVDHISLKKQDILPIICKINDGTQNLLAKLKSDPKFVENYQIIDMHLGSGGRLALLVENGTLFECIVGFNSRKLEFDFDAVTTRKIDMKGQRIVPFSRGLCVIGMINDYKNKNAASQRVLVHIPNHDVLAVLDNVDEKAGKETICVDFEAGIITQVYCDSKKNGSNLRTVKRTIDFPFNLAPYPPTGVFKGMTSRPIDERHILIAAVFYNVHLFILDNVTGDLHEKRVIGWEAEQCVPTLTAFVNNVAILALRHETVIDLVRVEYLPNDPTMSLGYQLLTRSSLGPGLLSFMGAAKIDGMLAGEGSTSMIHTDTKLHPDSCSIIVRVDSTARQKRTHTFLSVHPAITPGAGIQFMIQQLMQEPHKHKREFLGIPDEQCMVMIDAGVDKLELTRVDTHTILSFISPLRALAPMQYVKVKKTSEEVKQSRNHTTEKGLLFCSAVDGKNTVWLYPMAIPDGGAIVEHRKAIELPFTKSPAKQKLFSRVSLNDQTVHVYIYRLLEKSNFLEAVRIDMSINPKATDDCVYTLPPIFLEMEPVDPIKDFNIHLANGEFLFTNDAFRMIRVCHCCRAYYNDGKMPKDMENRECRSKGNQANRTPHVYLTPRPQ